MRRTFLSSPTPFARKGLSRRLLSEPCLDAALHDVLLRLLSQIPDHMPCTDSFPVLLPSTQNIYSIVSNIHIRQQFSMENKYAQTLDSNCSFGLVTSRQSTLLNSHRVLQLPHSFLLLWWN
jgi:hypothetical protein